LAGRIDDVQADFFFLLLLSPFAFCEMCAKEKPFRGGPVVDRSGFSVWWILVLALAWVDSSFLISLFLFFSFFNPP
jgi:hypothetical protein